MRRLTPAIVVTLLLTGSACASADSRPQDKYAKPFRACFSSDQVSSWRQVDKRTVNLRVNGKDVYRLDLFGNCQDVDTSGSLGIQSPSGATVCDGFGATLIVAGVTSPQHCPVTKITRLTPEQVAALPAQEKP